MKSTRVIIGVLALLLASMSPAYAASDSSDIIPLTLIRAVRISDTSITLSYATPVKAIGTVIYTASDGNRITLSDSEPQEDHLFTIDGLSPGRAHGYTLAASEGRDSSYQYTVLLSPDSIGDPGESVMPGYQVIGSDGAVISSVLAASAVPSPMPQHAVWWVLGTLAAAGLLGVGTRYLLRKKEPAFHETFTS